MTFTAMHFTGIINYSKYVHFSLCRLLSTYRYIRHACVHLDVGTCPHQVLTATLTLFQPEGGGQIMPTIYILMSNSAYESNRRASICFHAVKKGVYHRTKAL